MGAATAEDAKPNDDRVPDAYSITGHFDRIVVGRLKYQHLEPGTEVLTFVIVTIGVMNDAGFRHQDDEHYR